MNGKAWREYKAAHPERVARLVEISQHFERREGCGKRWPVGEDHP